VLVEDEGSISTVKNAVERATHPGLVVEYPSFRKAVIQRVLSGFQAMLTAFSLLAVVAGIIVCYSRLAAVFELRIWEVGLMRAVGVRHSAAMLELVKEGLLLAILGIILGCFVGSLAAAMALPIVGETTAIAFQLPTPQAQLHSRTGPYLIGALVGVVAAVTGASIPALRISSVPPVVAIRSRGRELGSTPSVALRGWRWWLATAVAASISWGIVFRNAVAGHIATVLIAILTVAVAGPMVSTLSWSIYRTMRQRLGPIGAMVLTNLTQSPRRSSLIVSIFGIGIGTILLFAILGWSFEHNLVAQLAGRLRGDLIVTSALLRGGAREAPLHEGILDELRAIPEVGAVAGEQQAHIPTDIGRVTVNAFDSEGFHDTTLFRWETLPGSQPAALVELRNGDAAVVSESFVNEHRVSVGDTITMHGATVDRTVRIVGIAAGLPESTLVIRRELYRELFHDEHVWLVHVATRPGTPVSDVESTIRRTLGQRYRLQVRHRSELIQYYGDLAHQAFNVLYVLEAMILALVLLAMADALAAAIAERQHSIGMMRAIGMRRADVFSMVVLEGAVLSLYGLMLAMASGLVMALLWARVQFPIVLGWTFDLFFPWLFFAFLVAATVGLSLAASALPGWRAARLAIPQALRSE